MGYGSIYADRTISHITPKEAKFLDRVFLKALAETPFFKKLQNNGFIEGSDVSRLNGAEMLYQQTGYHFFGDNEFAFRRFSDSEEYDLAIEKIQAKPLLKTTEKVIERLADSLENSLLEVENRCSLVGKNLGSPHYNHYFKQGAWQVYANITDLVPGILPKRIERETIKKNSKKE